MALVEAPPIDKPLLRGVSHQVAFFLALVAGGALTASQPAGIARLAVAVYATCLAGMLGISAAYHRPRWSPLARQRMRRLDHAGIFLQIAGTYTPICLLGVRGAAGERLCLLVWAGAGLGIVKSIFWAHAPKPLTALICVVLGWAVVGQWAPVRAAIGSSGVALLLVGGILYTAGALVYAAKRPNPSPRVFGYHEIFHAFVLVAAGCHFEVVRSLASAMP